MLATVTAMTLFSSPSLLTGVRCPPRFLDVSQRSVLAESELGIGAIGEDWKNWEGARRIAHGREEGGRRGMIR
jgi:hypothetical protein